MLPLTGERFSIVEELEGDDAAGDDNNDNDEGDDDESSDKSSEDGDATIASRKTIVDQSNFTPAAVATSPAPVRMVVYELNTGSFSTFL